MTDTKKVGVVEDIDIKQIIPYRKNARKSNNVELVKQSITEFGYNSYIVIDKENVIIAGHSRYKALTELGYKTIKVIRADLSQHEAKKYRLVDNKVQEKNEWIYEDLKIELRDLGNDFLIKETFGITLESIKDVNFNVAPVTLAQVEKQGEKNAETFTNTSKQRNDKQADNGREICCPHCYQTFLYD